MEVKKKAKKSKVKSKFTNYELDIVILLPKGILGLKKKKI